MNNLQCVIAVLESHREARRWADADVADDILRQLDLDPTAEAKNAAPLVDPGITEDEVIAHETAAKLAAEKADAARAALNAQTEAADKAKMEASADQAKAAKAERDGPANAPPAAHALPDPSLAVIHPAPFVPEQPAPAPVAHASPIAPVPLQPMNPQPFIAAEPVPQHP